MPLSTATITFDLSDHFGNDYDTRRGIRAWVDTNIPDDTIVDGDGNKVRIGSGKVTVADDGTGSFTVWVPGAGSNPASWQTKVHVEYVPNGNPRAGRTTRTFGPFTITGNADLADLIEEQEVPPEYAGQIVAQIEALRDETEAARDEAVDISGISTTDAAVKAGFEIPGSQSGAYLSATYAPKSSTTAAVQFGKITVGNTPVSGRVPFKSSQGLNVGQTGAGSRVAHLFQTVVVGGGWGSDVPPDPGFVWGTNFYTTTGTNAGDANGIVAMYGGLLEAAITAPAGSSLGTVIGCQAEASFAGATAGATVGTMVSLQIENPRRKDGATAGTATTAIGLRIKAVTAANTGATTAYTMLVEGGDSRFQSTITAELPGSGATADTLTLKMGASQTGNLLRFRDSSNGSVGRVTTAGVLAVFGRTVACETRGMQVWIGDAHPGDATKAAISFGSASDAVLFRDKAGVLRMRDQQVIATGSGTTAQRPTVANVVIGASYYDTTISKPVWSDGSNWRDAAGVIA